MAEHAIRLLLEYRTIIARAVAQQIAQTVPQYRSVNLDELSSNVESVLDGVVQILESRDVATVTRVTDLLAQMHDKRGFSVADFLVAVLCALPVIRRFYAKYTNSQGLGMHCYEQVEGVLIPLYGHLTLRLATGFEDDEEESTAVDPSQPADAEVEPLPFDIVGLDQVLQLKAEHVRITEERNHLARELSDMRDAVEGALEKKKKAKKGTKKKKKKKTESYDPLDPNANPTEQYYESKADLDRRYRESLEDIARRYQEAQDQLAARNGVQQDAQRSHTVNGQKKPVLDVISENPKASG